jgi:hypothetical protein
MAIIRTCLHTFSMGDVDDPYLYAAFPIHEWQQTEHGKWVMEHATEPPTFTCDPDLSTYGYRVTVSGHLTDKDYTYFMLKWGKR